MRNCDAFPAGSCSTPASVCGPTASAPVPYVMVVPLMTGATVALPSSVTPTGVACSLVTSEIELAEPTVEPSAGDEDTTRGAVLSTRIPATTSTDELPKESDTVARRSYSPSASLVVSKEELQGALVSVPMD